MFDNSFLTERVYYRGSLKNNDHGFEFTLRNRIDNGTLAGLKSLSVDGFELPLDSIAIQFPDATWSAAEVNYSNPVPLRVGQDARVIVAGNPLAPGLHNLVLTVSVVEIGRVQLKISDAI